MTAQHCTLRKFASSWSDFLELKMLHSEGKERKVQRFYVQFKMCENQLRLSHESNKKEDEKKQNKKNKKYSER